MILSGEKKVIDYLIKNKYGLLFIAVNLVAVFIRISGYHFVSGDMNVYLINWYNQIDNLGGANALKNQVGDYNILYQELIALAVFFRIPALMTFKMLSIFFDFLLSVVVGLVASSFNVKNKFRNFLFGYSFSILSPLVVLNSSFWGQADSIYAFFVLFSIFLIIKDKFMLSFIMLGLALAFKLQTVFILPFFFLIYALKKNFSILYFVFLPLMLYVVAIPSFFFGRDLLSPLTIYANQTEGYPLLTLNMPNIWTFFGGSQYDLLHKFAFFLFSGVIIIGFVVLLDKFTEFDKVSYEQLLLSALWFVWTAVMFLPAMHERYGFVIEMLIIALAVVNIRKYFSICLLMLIPILIEYSKYLFLTNNVPDFVLSLLYITGYIITTYLLFLTSKQKNAVEGDSVIDV